MALADHVSITISASTVTPSRPSFGTPAVASYLGPTPPWVSRSRSYASLAAAVADGIAATGDTRAAYLGLSAAFSQNPRPRRVKLLRLATAPTRTYTLTCLSAVQGAVYQLEVEGVLITRTVPAASTTTAEATAIELLIEAVPGVSSTIAAAVITLNHDTVASRQLRIRVLTPDILTLNETTADPGTAADLDAIEAVDADWFTLSLTGSGRAELNAAGAWIQARKKLLVSSYSDGAAYDPLSTTDAMFVARNATRDNVSLVYSADNMENKGAAWASRVLAFDPGSATWKFKTLSGMTSDALSDSQIDAIKAKNGNVYTVEAGVAFTAEGKCAGGAFLDQKHGLYWLEAEAQINVFALLLSAAKLPYLDEGTEAVEGALRSALDLAVSRSVIAPGYTVTREPVDDIDPSVRATRVYSGLAFSARGAGALHGIDISGTVGT